MKTKILADFQMCISVPLKVYKLKSLQMGYNWPSKRLTCFGWRAKWKIENRKFNQCFHDVVCYAYCSADNYYIYSCADNFLSPIPVSDWLIFCCRNLTLHQKHDFFDEKQHKNASECKHKVAFFTLCPVIEHAQDTEKI